jgi:LmbE family N-acetylglucosaminyl deacetylase
MNLIFDQNEKILFIGCHPDDIELGCGGLIQKLPNDKIFAVILSKNNNKPEQKNLMNESTKSLKILGFKTKNIIFKDFKTREFSYSRQEICDYLWTIKKKIKPTCVFTTPNDLHQDHRVCNIETQRVFRDKSIFEYDLARSTIYDKSIMFVTLGKKEMMVKVKALEQFKTYKNKNYFDKDLILSQAKNAGIKQNIKFAEVFRPLTIIV